MNVLLNNLLPYLDSSSFSYMPMQGKEKTSLDLYYEHKIWVGHISVDNDKLYLYILVECTESLEDSIPTYYSDLDKFLNRFNLKYVLKFKKWDNNYEQICEILSPKTSLVKYINFLTLCKSCMIKTTAEQSIEIMRKIQDEFG